VVNNHFPVRRLDSQFVRLFNRAVTANVEKENGDGNVTPH
jgi:hypothetical protein